jgi:tetratricopeptide (TPR) repeat protein
MPERTQIKPAVAALVVIVVLASFCYLLLMEWYDPDVPFLRTWPQANWIVRYSQPDTVARSRDSAIVTGFSKEFNLNDMPMNARLYIRAFKEYRLRINGDELVWTEETPENWKTVDVFDITSLLRSGMNTIEVRVTCPYGPSALWLYTTGLEHDLRTDNTWSASVSDGPSINAAVANDCVVHPAGLDGPRPLKSLLEKLPAITLFFCICSVIFCLHVYCRKNTRFAQHRLMRLFTLTPRLVLILATTVWTVVFVANARHIPTNLGFDATSHIKYIRYLLQHHAVPLASEGPQAYQPPLFYVLSALLLSAAELVLSDQVAQMTLKILPFLCGVGQIIVAYFAARTVFAGSKNKQMLSTAFAALIPMNIYISHYVSNESASALLIGLMMLTAIIMLAGKSSAKLFSILAVLAALALLTKFTALAVIPVVALTLFYKLISEERKTWTRTAGYFGLTAVVIFGLAGWFYLRNWVSFGKPLVGNWDPVLPFNWWQDPGFHTYRYFCRFGSVFTAPWLSGFSSFFDSIYATFWGDSLLGGRTAYIYGPPWDYEYIAVVYLLAVPATLLIIIGMLLALHAVVSRADKIWLLILGSLFAAGFSLTYMNLWIPYYGQSKAFYCLFAVVPIALTFAFGFDAFDRWLRDKRLLPGRVLLYGWFGTLMLVILSAFLIRPAQKPKFLDLAALAAQGRLDEAVAYYTRLINSNPDNPYTHCELGISYTLQRRYRRAAEHFEKTIQLKPDWPGMYKLLGDAYLALGEHSLAVVNLTRCVQLEPGNTGSLNNLAWILATTSDLALRNPGNAITYAARACELSLDNPAPLDTLAVAYAAAGNFPEAVKTAEKAIKLAEAAGEEGLAEQIKTRLQLYKDGQPYRQK